MKYGIFLILSCALAQAASFTIDFTSSGTTPTTIANGSPGNVVVYNLSGVNVTVTAWSVLPTTINNVTSSLFNRARLRDYGTVGLGVCNTSENSDGTCSSSGSPSEHQVDNVTPGKDYVMFQFSNPNTNAQLLATNMTVRFGSLAGDWDVSYWLGDTPSNFGSTGLTNLNTSTNLTANGFSSRVDVWNGSGSPLTSVSGIVTHTIGNLAGADTLIYGTMLSGSNDGFKIRSLSFTIDPRIPTNEAIPEPSTYALLGAGLAAIAYNRRKR